MTKYIAFLRAINVGGHTVKMTDLKRMFEGLGFSAVETFIASGNVAFDAKQVSTKALESTIASHLHARLGYPVATFIRTVPELKAIASRRPFPASNAEADGAGLYVAFLADAPTAAATRTLMAAPTKVDRFKVHGKEVYWLIRSRFSESEFSGARLEKVLGMPVTVRNVTTVRRLAAKYAGGSDE